eukprot:gene27488-4795_t
MSIVASIWSESSSDAPIDEGGVEIIDVTSDCIGFSLTGSVAVTFFINLPPGETATTDMLASFKEISALTVAASSFGKQFGIKGITVTISDPVTKTSSSSSSSSPSSSSSNDEDTSSSSTKQYGVYESIPIELELSLPVPACLAVGLALPVFTPLLTALVASLWSESDSDAPIEGDSVEVADITSDCIGFSLTGSVAVTFSINLPPGETATTDMLASFKKLSAAAMAASSFGKQFGIKGVTVTISKPIYGSWPTPTITTPPRVPNTDFYSIPTEVDLTVSFEACLAINSSPAPFKEKFQEEVASDWNTANPGAYIMNGDVEVISVVASCGSRRSHRSLLQPSFVATQSSVNLPPGVQASGTMIDSFQQESTASMMGSSFTSDFGIKSVSVTPSTTAETKTFTMPPPSPPPSLPPSSC